MSAISVIGAGAFGTALAIALGREGRAVALHPRSRAHAEEMRAERQNRRRLPGLAFPEGLAINESYDDLADTVLLAIPMQTVGAFVKAHRAQLAGRAIVASCKGLDLKTGQGATALIAAGCPEAFPAILSGPGFAADIAAGLPTAMTLAAQDPARGRALQHALSTSALRLYFSDDVAGVELGGALKNVVAIAAGITMGAGLGESARAAVMTRGFSEMKRLAHALGARPDTLSGLSGFGDLVLTGCSEKSRNTAYGLAIGRGETPAEGITVEGRATARAALAIADERGIEIPLTSAIVKIMDGEQSIAAAMSELLARPLTEE